MSRGVKAALITAVGCVVVGLGLFMGGMMMAKWDFKSLSTDRLEENRHTVTEEFQKISVKTDTAAVRFALSEDGACRVDCRERTSEKHTVSVRDGVLIVEGTDKRGLWDHIGFHFETPQITLYLPQTAYTALQIRSSTGRVNLPEGFTFGDIRIEVSTGDVFVGASAEGTLYIRSTTGDISAEDLTAGAVELSVSTGRVSVDGVSCGETLTVTTTTGKVCLNDVTCQDLKAEGSTGELVMQNVIAAEGFAILRRTGDVRMNGCDAAAIQIQTSTGRVTGSLLTQKVFVTRTDTGRVRVPDTREGGLCEITTDTGNIEIEISA